MADQEVDSVHSAHVGMDMDMPMVMTFYFSTSCTVLFDDWNFSSVGGLIGSMIAIFLMTATYEGIKYYREHIWRRNNPRRYRSTVKSTDTPSTSDKSQVQQRMISKQHLLQTFLHIIQIILSYFLMLIFMTYNGWLCIALVAGAELATSYLAGKKQW